MGIMNEKPMERIIQESVPGKQVTIAHVIASPMFDIYERLGIDDKGAIGILTALLLLQVMPLQFYVQQKYLKKRRISLLQFLFLMISITDSSLMSR